FQSISIILSPYHSYLLIPFLTLLIYSLNGYVNLAKRGKWKKNANGLRSSADCQNLIFVKKIYKFF
ncbi:MAG: hypothetical protein AB1414_04390, partial [bacterium]